MMSKSGEALRNILITGASRGIGLGLVKLILESYPSYRVVATCRQPEAAAELQGLKHADNGHRLVVLPLDTTQKESYQRAAARLAELNVTSIDVLVANAGIASSNRNHHDSPLYSNSEDMLNVYNTNVVGSMLTLQSFNDLVCAADKGLVVVVSSVMGSIERTAGAGMYASYRASKAALNMLAVTYSEESVVRAAEAKVLCLHPGWVQTDMGQSGGRRAPVTVQDSTEGTLRLIEAARAAQGHQPASGPADAEDSRYATFQQKLRSEHCVFVGFDGQLYPW